MKNDLRKFIQWQRALFYHKMSIHIVANHIKELLLADLI